MLAGYRVPEDVSVVGFDNYMYPGRRDIGVTTYEINMQEMAERTMHKIIKRYPTKNILMAYLSWMDESW